MHSAAEIIFVILVGVVLVLVIWNIVFSIVAERKNPPIGSFIECGGVRLHYPQDLQHRDLEIHPAAPLSPHGGDGLRQQIVEHVEIFKL